MVIRTTVCALAVSLLLFACASPNDRDETDQVSSGTQTTPTMPATDKLNRHRDTNLDGQTGRHDRTGACRQHQSGAGRVGC